MPELATYLYMAWQEMALVLFDGEANRWGAGRQWFKGDVQSMQSHV